MPSSPKKIEYEYQHYISSTNGFIFIDVSIFLGARFEKAPGVGSKWGLISKKIWISDFFGQRQKFNTQASRNSKMTQNGSALLCYVMICALAYAVEHFFESVEFKIIIICIEGFYSKSDIAALVKPFAKIQHNKILYMYNYTFHQVNLIQNPFKMCQYR